MKNLVLVLCLAVLAACSGAPTSGGEGAFVAITIPLTGDQCGVADAYATVSAADISPPIGPESLNVKDFTYITGIISDVPLGLARKISIDAVNSLERVVYSGYGFVDVLVEDVAAPIDIVLYRNWLNCPDNGGIICLEPPCYGSITVNATLSDGKESSEESANDPNIDRLLGTVRVWKM